MASGAPLDEDGLALARHARACEPCVAFVDEVARTRAWLLRGVRPRLDTSPRHLQAVARRALVSALAARCARDLVQLAEGRDVRGVEARRADLRRVARLIGVPGLRRPPWQRAVAALLGKRSAPPRARWFAIAAALDPFGLDVALPHLAKLEASGRRSEARREVDRLMRVI